MAEEQQGGCLAGVRILELADELGEYVGRVLAGLGADVVKVEPPHGEITRTYGPFVDDDPESGHSLYFWQYGLGKRSVVLDLDDEEDKARFISLAEIADVVVDTRPRGYLESRALGYEQLSERNPGLILTKITPFGESGPWASYVGSDLVHLALGGVMMNTGYDPDPAGRYETPPIAPAMWHSYHVVGEHVVMSILAALYHRQESDRGQRLSASVHQAVATNTESDLPSWIALRRPYFRQTARHAMPSLSLRSIAPTKDGRYLMPYTTYVKNFPSSWDVDIAVLRKYGMQEDLDDPQWEDPDYRADHQQHIADVMDRLIKRCTYDSGLWQEMVQAGLTWAPIRRPAENLDDPHWAARGVFGELEHPEIDRSVPYVVSRWVSPQAPWVAPRRAPRLGAQTANEVMQEWSEPRTEEPPYRRDTASMVGPSGRPFPLSGVRVVDLSWMLASAGGGRYLAALGADVIKVEHTSRLDGMRTSGIYYPDGGRRARDEATAALSPSETADLNQSANFNEINTGKRAISLNLRTPRGRSLLEQLIKDADVVIEGYSPGTMKRMGLDYERLKEINPHIIYVQQSGFGELGTYGRARAFGPTAQAFSGITEMSGLPDPWPPAGIGYSYLDWFGAYNMATAVLAGLYRLGRTGKGCHIDTSQAEVGIYLSGTAIMDTVTNSRPWQRMGNRSPYKVAAPSGAYPCAGTDRWIAISSFTEEQWKAIIEVLAADELATDPRFQTSELRLAHQDALDEVLGGLTARRDGYELMRELQSWSVPAGVAQTAEDRVDHDPQLAADEWLVDLEQSTHGTWPAKAYPVRHSGTPAHIGGIVNRHGPNYGEDTDAVLRDILGLATTDIAALRTEGVI